MPLLVPFVIFLVLSVFLIVLLGHTHSPTAIDTTEALCDAIIRNDEKTVSTMMTLEVIPTPVVRVLGELKDDHQEIATNYNSKIVKEWDDVDSSYAVVSVPLKTEGESILFTCRYVVNQWTIIKIKIESPKIVVN